MTAVTLLGTGSPLPDAHRAGPATLVSARAAVGTLVLTHYVPAIPLGGGDDWRALAAAHFDGVIELGDDLHRVEITPG